uniref:Uncharacterized protein n=1 Tax=Lotus japonicus TaxID=34305 RepID=I3SE59_LOTJA|nr:unknown [Lotus japonicus]
MGPFFCCFFLHKGKDGLCKHLVCSHKVNHYSSICNVYEPIWIVETKASKKIPWCCISKSSIAHATTEHVECCGHCNAYLCSFLHCFCLKWWGFHCVLNFNENHSK